LTRSGHLLFRPILTFNIVLLFSIAPSDLSALQPACLSSIPFGRVYLWYYIFVY
ncbi:hypothetical protein JB92DRAFT_2876682, partial [Gautieria morchelliformis]